MCIHSWWDKTPQRAIPITGGATESQEEKSWVRTTTSGQVTIVPQPPIPDTYMMINNVTFRLLYHPCYQYEPDSLKYIVWCVIYLSTLTYNTAKTYCTFCTTFTCMKFFLYNNYHGLILSWYNERYGVFNFCKVTRWTLIQNACFHDLRFRIILLVYIVESSVSVSLYIRRTGNCTDFTNAYYMYIYLGLNVLKVYTCWVLVE